MKKTISTSLIFFVFIISSILPMPASALSTTRTKSAAKYLISAVPAPEFGSIGGEWTIAALKAANAALPDGYEEKYINSVKNTLTENGGILSERKYTEYARLIIALRALERDPKNIFGYDITERLGEYDAVVAQGINGAAYALIAANGTDYITDEIKQKYIIFIESFQNSDGGFGLSDESDPDITAIAIQALAPNGSSQAVENAVNYLSTVQNQNGGFYSAYGGENSESCAQVILALNAANIEISDPRFVKGTNTVVTAINSYLAPDGGFKHNKTDDSANIMATEQVLYALSVAEWAPTSSERFEEFILSFAI